MNAEQLNAIKERAAKATPGPWKYSKQYGYLAPVIPQQHVAVICNEILRNDDAEFIATAREDVPALVAEVERYHDLWYHGLGKADAEIQANLHVIEAQQQEIEQLRKALEYYADEKHYEPYAITDVNPCDITEDGGYIAREALRIGEESNAL